MHRDVGGPGTALLARRSAGFALVETLLAALLLAAGTAGIAGALRGAWRTMAAASAASAAVGHLADLAEQLRAASPADRAAVAAAWQGALGDGAAAVQTAGAGGVARWQARVGWQDRLSADGLAIGQVIGLAP
jgi:Tfp pilus assembly protein PilV